MESQFQPGDRVQGKYIRGKVVATHGNYLWVLRDDVNTLATVVAGDVEKEELRWEVGKTYRLIDHQHSIPCKIVHVFQNGDAIYIIGSTGYGFKEKKLRAYYKEVE